MPYREDRSVRDRNIQLTAEEQLERDRRLKAAAVSGNWEAMAEAQQWGYQADRNEKKRKKVKRHWF